MKHQIRELESQCWEPRKYGPAWFNSEKFADLVAAEKEKQIIDILKRLQERNESHNYYKYAINVIKGEV